MPTGLPDLSNESIGSDRMPIGAHAAVAAPSASSKPYVDGPRLLADIGGTNARFALERSPGAIEKIHVYPCANFPGIAEAINAFYQDVKIGPGNPVAHAAIAIANPIDGDEVTMTNHDWRFSIEATRRALGMQTLTVVNDFAALAQAVPALKEAQLRQIGGGIGRPDGVRAVLGAGTGLGVAGLVHANDRWIPIASEGGHATFAAVDEREDRILVLARQKWGHVSYERVASGPGIEFIYWALGAGRASALAHSGASVHLPSALASDSAMSGTPDTAAIVQLAEQGDALALETVEVFCGILGSFAGSVAITFGAQGGIFLGGGVVPKLGERFYSSAFRSRFEQKGRFVRYLSSIPTYVITAENPAFIGASEILTTTLS